MQTRVIILLGLLNLATASSVFADHERSRIHRHYDQLRREVHEQRRWQFEQLHDFHRARRDALEESWKIERRYLRGRTRVHFDRQYHEQRRQMERDFDRRVKSLNGWRKDEIDRLQQAERSAIRAYEAGFRSAPYSIVPEAAGNFYPPDRQLHFEIGGWNFPVPPRSGPKVQPQPQPQGILESIAPEWEPLPSPRSPRPSRQREF